MARVGLEAFTVLNGFEVIHLAGSFASFGIDAGPHGDLCVDAEVVAMSCDGLREQQNRNAEQAETAYGRQHWVEGWARTISRAVSCCWLWSTMRRLCWISAYGQPCALIGLEKRF